MTGLILDSKNMILPEDPAISPTGLPNLHYCVTILCAAPVSKLQPSNMDIEAGV
jgi:hypothetical protein